MADGVRGHLGMLAVEEHVRGRGLGRALIAAGEAWLREARVRIVDIEVVNLRTELVSLYEKLGYRVLGTAPYVKRDITQPCYFVRMAKDIDV
jgi:ribosomal protein S18 acetylase RimI-like enzyme